MTKISTEAFNVLQEIIENENISEYWIKRFSNLSNKNDTILRGCFKELSEAGYISVQWADNRPYIIHVLKDGYLYEEHIQEERKIEMTQFERELNRLLESAKSINIVNDINFLGYNRPSDDWVNDMEIFFNKYLKEHPLAGRIKTLSFHRSGDYFSQLVSCLKSIAKDKDFIDKMNGIEKKTIPAYQAKTLPKYDVFLSHANADKLDIVEELNNSLEKLGVEIFYDKKSLEWGDKWKDRILEGTKNAEFAIIVISENFFDREWTEKELSEFLNRQNRNGQKLILPIVHNITNDDLKMKYPSIAEIQAIDSNNYTCDEIALLFARQLIKRLKAVN